MSDPTTTTPIDRGNEEESLVIYSYSPVFYWWPVWLVGFIMALITYLDGGRMAWTPLGAEARRDWQVQTETGQTETREGILLPQGEGKRLFPTRPESPGEPLGEPNQPQVRMSRHKFLGFLFSLVLLFVYLHSNVLWRGFRAYFFLALGIVALLSVMLIHTAFPEWGVWGWVKQIVYHAPDIYISMDGYLFIASLVLAVWLFVIRVYNRWTFMKFESGQVRVVEEIGEGETVYDTTNMTFEKLKDDFFRHRILGLGFLRPLRYLLPRRLARLLGLSKMTGTGDLIVRVGGDGAKVILWPNVLNVDSKLERITKFIKSRPVVSE